jgi:hypothetical protein
MKRKIKNRNFLKDEPTKDDPWNELHGCQSQVRKDNSKIKAKVPCGGRRIHISINVAVDLRGFGNVLNLSSARIQFRSINAIESEEM